MIDLTKEEDHANIIPQDNSLDYGMELLSDEELLQGEELEQSHIVTSIPKGAKRQGRLRAFALSEIEAELSQLCQEYIAGDASHTLNNPALKELEKAQWEVYHQHW
jgi:hypothetical protein